MVGGVRIMGEELANRIAAGEVVERPASVVKELVENSLDAGATSIEVTTQDGGSKNIAVMDDGEGMDKEDLLLCLERFATSKLKTLEGLYNIETYGFRGEALPSIASVSKMTIITRKRGDLEGWRLESEGGKVKSVDAFGCAPGTAVEVSDLFFNTPARRKFLKSRQTETAQIGNVLTRLALARTDIGFKFTSNSRRVFTCRPGESLVERASNLLGRDLAGDLFPFSMTQGKVSVHGLASPPHITRNSMAKAVTIFVNKRPVKDKALVHAILSAYRGMVGEGRFPVVLVWVELPPADVDVNVHPSKSEVRFHSPGDVYGVVSAAVSAALSGSPWLPGDFRASGTRYDPRTGEVLEDRGHEGMGHGPELHLGEGWTGYRKQNKASAIPFGSVGERDRGHADFPEIPGLSGGGGDETDRTEHKEKFLYESLKYIGTLAKTYLIFEGRDKMIVVDQHAAAERVTFSKLLQQARTGGVVSQGLLVPVKLKVSLAEAQMIDEICERMTELGFDAEPFGRDTILVRSIPSLLADSNVEKLVRDVMDDVLSFGASETSLEKEESILATMACHSSVRAGRELAPEEVYALLESLKDADTAGSCPHGRPVAAEIGLEEIEKWFDRR